MGEFCVRVRLASLLRRLLLLMPRRLAGLHESLPSKSDQHSLLDGTQYVSLLSLLLLRSPSLSAAVYRACELASDGKADSTAAFISRFFRLCLRTVCSPAPGETGATGAAVMPPPHPLEQRNGGSSLGVSGSGSVGTGTGTGDGEGEDGQEMSGTTLAPSYAPTEAAAPDPAVNGLPAHVRFPPLAVSTIPTLLSQQPPSFDPFNPTQAFSMDNTDATYWCVSLFRLPATSF
jgi:hypothetical protein